MNISDETSIKDLKREQKRIEKLIKAKQHAGKKKKENFYFKIKDDHKRHLRSDGRKLFRSVVDYLECYVNGLPPIAKNQFKSRFGIESTRGKVTPEIISLVKTLLGEGKTLKEASDVAGVSVASCQKIKRGDYDS